MQYIREFTWSGLDWFNLGSGALCIRLGRARVLYVWLWDCFNHECADGAHYWGVGVLNLNGRHLLYAGFDHVDVLFVRVWHS